MVEKRKVRNRYNFRIIKIILQILKPKGIVVIPLVTLESIAEIKKIFESSNYKLNIKQIQACRGVPLSEGTRLSPMNPIFIVQGKNI